MVVIKTQKTQNELTHTKLKKKQKKQILFVPWPHELWLFTLQLRSRSGTIHSQSSLLLCYYYCVQ